MRNRNPNIRNGLTAILLLGLATTIASCTTAGYAIQERFGIEKRDILVNRVEDVATAQGDAKEEFANALEAFRSVVAVDGGDLEENYDRLSKAYDRSESRADDVRNRIISVNRVATDLFSEWESELGQYSDAGLRRASQSQLDDTRERYETLHAKMNAASASMDPVLTVFSDRVLFLKHNLNARAIAAIGAESQDLETDVARLIEDMERSIAEADAFIAEFKGANT